MRRIAVTAVMNEAETEVMHEVTPTEIADQLSRALPGHKVEIIQGRVTVAPGADGPHAETLGEVDFLFRSAGVRKARLRSLQNIGIWLESGSDDFAIPDLSLVEENYKESLVRLNSYSADVFRLILEVTSTNWADDVHVKAGVYAESNVPVYVIADRKHGSVVVLSDPRKGTYRTRSAYGRGEEFTLPACVGLNVTLPVDLLLDGDA
jgi:hypothetical protein